MIILLQSHQSSIYITILAGIEIRTCFFNDFRLRTRPQAEADYKINVIHTINKIVMHAMQNV